MEGGLLRTKPGAEAGRIWGCLPTPILCQTPEQGNLGLPLWEFSGGGVEADLLTKDYNERSRLPWRLGNDKLRGSDETIGGHRKCSVNWVSVPWREMTCCKGTDIWLKLSQIFSLGNLNLEGKPRGQKTVEVKSREGKGKPLKGHGDSQDHAVGPAQASAAYTLYFLFFYIQQLLCARNCFKNLT